LELPEHWEQLVTDLVASILERGIGHIFHMGKMILIGIGLYFFTAKRQHRPHDMVVDREDAMQTGETGPSKQIDEKGLGSIVAMMGRQHGGIALLYTDLLKVCVPKSAGSILDTQMHLLGIVQSVKLGHMDGHAILLRQLADKLLISVAVTRTKMKIAMRHGKRKSRNMHQMGQNHRIYTAANG